MTLILSDPRIFRNLLILIAVIGVAAIYLAFRNKDTGAKKAKGPLLLLNLDKAGPPAPEQPPASPTPASIPAAQRQVPAFVTLHGRPWALTDLFRALLVFLSLAVAAGLALIVLPQPAADKLVQDLQSRRAASQQEKIAFLYLGDEVKDNAFHVRGVVRNITDAPIEQLDAAVRFYAHDGSVLQTTIVRMNKEAIAPDEIAQFELVYPNYKMEFASYAVEFKLRQGPLVPYKDMRKTRAAS